MFLKAEHVINSVGHGAWNDIRLTEELVYNQFGTEHYKDGAGVRHLYLDRVIAAELLVDQSLHLLEGPQQGLHGSDVNEQLEGVQVMFLV